MAKQYKYKEFFNLINKIIKENRDFYHCADRTLLVLCNIMLINNPYQADDLEYLMDMVNMELRKRDYQGSKNKFPISQCLDIICRESVFYIDQQIKEIGRRAV